MPDDTSRHDTHVPQQGSTSIRPGRLDPAEIEESHEPVVPSADFDFLWWLGRYLGTWRASGLDYQVRRRCDGWLEARRLTPYGRVTLSTALTEAVRVQEPPGPLGPHPVALSRPLMELWLTPDDLQHLKNAWRVSVGLALIHELIERRIREFDEQEQKRRWSLWWAAGASEDPEERDLTYVDELQAAYEQTLRGRQL